MWRICGCVCRVAAAARVLTAYFTTYLHISKPSCNIGSQSSAVVCCRSHQFSASLSFMCNLFVWPTSSYSHHLCRATSCPCVTECILCYLLYYPHCLGDSLVYQKFFMTHLQAQGFHSFLRCKTVQYWNNETLQEDSCTITFFALPQLNGAFIKVFNLVKIPCTLASWKDLVR